MPEINVQLRHFIATSVFVAIPLTALADGGSIRFGGRIVDPTCTIHAASGENRKMSCPTDQVVQVRVMPVGTSSHNAALALDGKPLRNAESVNYRFRAEKNVALSQQRLTLLPTATPGNKKNAVIVSLSYL